MPRPAIFRWGTEVISKDLVDALQAAGLQAPPTPPELLPTEADLLAGLEAVEADPYEEWPMYRLPGVSIFEEEVR